MCHAVGVLECWKEGGNSVASTLLDVLTTAVALVSSCDTPQTISQPPKGSPGGGPDDGSSTVVDPDDEGDGKDALTSAATNACCQCHCSNNPWLT